MIDIDQKQIDILKKILEWEKKHPYAFSFILSVIIISYALFYSLPLEITDEDIIPAEKIEFIDYEKIKLQMPKRITRKSISATDGETTSNPEFVERAEGTSDEQEAVDTAFITESIRLRAQNLDPIKMYPKIAQDKGIEAIVDVQVLISSNGKVRNVNILSIRLKASLPPEIYSEISRAFARKITSTYYNVRYDPPIYRGRRTPVKYIQTLKFELTKM